MSAIEKLVNVPNLTLKNLLHDIIVDVEAAIVALQGQAQSAGVPVAAPVNATAATIATALTGANNDLTFTAKTKGANGNDLSVTYLTPAAAGQAIGVTLANGTDIVVALAGTPAVAASGTATIAAGNLAHNEAVVVGDTTYTYKTLTKAAGTITVADSQNASGDDTITIGTRVYTFKAALTEPAEADEIKIGDDAAGTAVNIKDAILATVGAIGTTVSTGTVANTQVSAAAATRVVTVTALANGTAGNAIALAKSGTHLAVSAATLTGGTDGPTAANQVLVGANNVASALNLKDAILATTGALGTTVGTGTTANANVTAAVLSNVVTVTAKVAGTAGNALGFTTTAAQVTLDPADDSLGGGAVANTTITSTATNVKTAIEAFPAAHALVTVANSGGDNGTGVVTAMAKTNLAAAVNGTVAAGGTLQIYDSKIYVAIADNTIADANWKSADLA